MNGKADADAISGFAKIVIVTGTVSGTWRAYSTNSSYAYYEQTVYPNGINKVLVYAWSGPSNSGGGLGVGSNNYRSGLGNAIRSEYGGSASSFIKLYGFVMNDFKGQSYTISYLVIGMK